MELLHGANGEETIAARAQRSFGATVAGLPTDRLGSL